MEQQEVQSATPVSIGRALWLKERQRGIGGSDAAAILGISPYSSGYDVWLAKTGRERQKQPSEAMWWGTEMEALIARRYSEMTGLRLWTPGGVLAHPKHPELIGTPDRLVAGQRRGLEVKTASAYKADEWGREGTDEVPPHYLVQCAHYIALTGFERWDVAVLIGGNDLRIYTVRRNAKLEESMIEQLTAWWRRHVVEGVEPPITARSMHAVEDAHPENDGTMLEPTQDAEIWGAKLMAARALVRQYQDVADEAEANLKDIIGSADGVTGFGWKATWKNTKPKKVWDLGGLCGDLEARLIESGYFETAGTTLAAVREQHVTEAPAQRRFLFTTTKGRE